MFKYNENMQQAKFIAPVTTISTNFWTTLYEKKLNEYKLDSSQRDIYYNNSFDETSFENNSGTKCKLLLFNTIEDFNSLNKKYILEQERDYLLIAPELYRLHRFETQILLVYIDLKKFTFKYISGFPTVVPIDTPYEFEQIKQTKEMTEINFDCPSDWGKRYNKNSYYALKYKVIKKGEIIGFDWRLRNFLAFLSRQNTYLEEAYVNIMLKFQNGENMLFKFRLQKYSHEKFHVIGLENQKVLDLKTLLDKSQFVKDANDLNLKLMKWNMWTDLNLEKIENTRCLLLGAGTIGCNIARLLVGWGFKNLTFVDNGKISYSTPARQSLYNCDDIGKFKAIVASETLLKIHTYLNCNSHTISILCPSHPIIDESQSFSDFHILSSLVEEHDVIFTLTDDRESRWLPIILTNIHQNKILINVALGFESYVVSKFDTNNIENGCYFCSDILSVYNSHIKRTEDQKCTITRPGISAIASGLAVEMLINHIHDRCTEVEQIRGDVLSYEINYMKASKSLYCVACSSKIKEEYLKHKYNFVKNACNDSTYLEKISGIKEYLENSNLDCLNIECDD